MASFNKILLMGNLTRDPQLSYTPSATAVCDIGLATNRKWTAQDGSQRDETCFIDARAWGKTAELINKNYRKGQPLFIEGRLVFESWTGQDGAKRAKHRVTIENLVFLPIPRNGGGPPASDGYGPPGTTEYPQSGTVSGPPRGQRFPDDGSDIPFE